MAQRRQLDLIDFLPAYSGINADKTNPFFAFYPDRVPKTADKQLIPAYF